MKDELLKGLNEQQIARIKACKNNEEMLKIAKEEGVELNDEQLSAISGGCSSGGNKCPKCGSNDFESSIVKNSALDIGGSTKYKCKKCGHVWFL